MYEVVGFEMVDETGSGVVRAGEPFSIAVTVCCRDDAGCGPADVVVALDGQPVASEPVDLHPDGCATIEASQGRQRPPWVNVGSGQVTVDRHGSLELSVTIGDTRWATDIDIAPPKPPLDSGHPLERRPADG